VIGGGNTAMGLCPDLASPGGTAGLDRLPPVEKEMPARIEEIHHAKKKGLNF